MAKPDKALLRHCLLFVVSLTMTTAAVNIKTPLYERCSHFRQPNRSYKCVERQNYGCQAEKIPSNNSVSQCSDGLCPPKPIHLSVIHYKKQRYLGGNYFTGINITWAVDTRNDLHKYLDGFHLALQSSDRIFVIKMKVNVTQQPTDQTSKMWFRFDCFYPIPKNQSWLLTVTEIPYDPRLPSMDAKIYFTLDNKGDMVQNTLPPLSHKITPGSTVHSTSVATTRTDNNIYGSSETFPKVGQSIQQSLASAYGVSIGVSSGVLIVLLFVGVIFFTQWQKKHLQTGNSVERSQKRVLLLHAGNGTEHLQCMKDLCQSLAEICHVIQLSDKGCKRKYYIKSLIDKLDFIIIVSSDAIVETVAEIQRKMARTDTEVAQALNVLIQNGERMSSKVVTVYFPREKHFQVLNGISLWCPVALPANKQTIIDWIQHVEPNKLITAEGTPDIERSHQVSCTPSTIQDPSLSECTSVMCHPSTICKDSGFQESGMYSMTQADEAHITDVHNKNFYTLQSYPQFYMQNCNMIRQNVDPDCNNLISSMFAEDVNNRKYLSNFSSTEKYQNVYSDCYKPPKDCYSINTDISSCVDVINSEQI